MKAPIIYSPHPPSEYILEGMPRCEVSVMLMQPRGYAIWNLFWMSVPGIDAVIGTGINWHKVYEATQGLYAAIEADVREDEKLHRYLTKHPSNFGAWFKDEDASIFDTYEVLGDAWAETVLQRATMAAARLDNANRVVARHGNIVEVAFGRRAA